MKKLMVALGAAVVCGAVLADSAVESGVVGYNTTAITGDMWYMVGTQFKTIGGNADTINVQDLVKLTGISACPKAQKATAAAQIQMWTGLKYDLFYYVTDATGATGPAWMKNNNPKVATDEIQLGQGFWFKVPSSAISGSATATFAGEVKGDATSKTFSIGDTEWKMISNPFPVALTDAMISLSGVSACPKADKATSAPQMQVWSGTKYDLYYYVTDATGATGPAWMKNNNPKMATGTFIPVGGACWFKAPNAGTVTIDINAGN